MCLCGCEGSCGAEMDTGYNLPGTESEDSLKKVSRVDVIDASGRAYVKYGVDDVRFDIQDNGRTLKIFIKEE